MFGNDTPAPTQNEERVQSEGVQNGYEVTVDYEVLQDNSQKVIDSSRIRHQPLKFVIGSDEVIPALEEAVKTMNVGERKRFPIDCCSIANAVGSHAALRQTIPENQSRYELDVELRSSHRKKLDKWQMTWDEKLQTASDLKDKGNYHFKLNEYTDSISAYREAVDLFERIEECTDNIVEIAKPIRIACLLNLSLCLDKAENYLEASIVATTAIAIEKSAKALYRRGVARMHYEDYEAAKKDLTEAARMNTKDVEIRETLAECRRRHHEADLHEKAKFGKGIFARSIYGKR